MKAAMYVLYYIHSTHDYGMSFMLKNQQPIHTFLHFPDSSDAEAYDGDIPPKPTSGHKLTTYSDACWGFQIGNVMKEGTLLTLFKFRSVSGAIVFRISGPIAWNFVLPECTSLSSYEAEI